MLSVYAFWASYNNNVVFGRGVCVEIFFSFSCFVKEPEHKIVRTSTLACPFTLSGGLRP